LIRQLIRIEEARGNAEAAWNLEQELLSLVERHPSDLRRVPMLLEIRDKRLGVLARYKGGDEFPPQIILGCYYSTLQSDGARSACRSGSRRVVIANIQWEADGYLREAQRTLARNFSACTRPLAYESAASTGASASELSRIASRKDTAVAELQEQRVVHEKRFGPVRYLDY